MAANQAVMEAAKAAYSTPQGMYDVSDYVNGIVNIAQGVVKANERTQLEAEKLNKRKFNTNIGPINDMAKKVQNEFALGNITIDDAMAIFDNIEYDVNNTIPSITSLIGKLLSTGKDGFSGSASPILETYAQSFALGEWDKTITVGGENYPSFWTLQEDIENPGKMKMMVVGMDGKYVDPQILEASLKNAPRISDGDAAHNLVSSFVGDTFKNRDLWQARVNETLGKLHSMFKNNNAKMSYLIDNTNVVGGEITSFVDYYIKNALGDEADIQKYEDAIAGLSGQVSKKTKNILATQLMQSDNNLDADIDEYLKDIFDSRKPKKITVVDEFDGSNFDPNKNASTKKLHGANDLVMKLVNNGKFGENQTHRHNPNLYIGEGVGAGTYAFYRNVNEQGKDDIKLSLDFDPNKPASIRKVMLNFGDLLDLGTTRERNELDNFLIKYGYL